MPPNHTFRRFIKSNHPLSLFIVLLIFFSTINFIAIVKSNPRNVVIWFLDRNLMPETYEVNGTMVHVSSPPPFLDLENCSTLLADAVVAKKLSKTLLEYAESGGVVILSGNYSREETIEKGNGLIIKTSKDPINAAVSALSKTTKKLHKGTIKLAVKYSGPLNPPLSLFTLKGPTYIERVVDREKFEINIYPGVYYIRLKNVLEELNIDFYPISVWSDAIIHLNLLSFSKVIIVVSNSSNVGISQKKNIQIYRVEKQENTNTTIIVYDLIYKYTPIIHANITLNGESIPISIYSGDINVYTFYTPKRLEPRTIKDSLGSPLPNAHIFLIYKVNKTRRIWAWRTSKDGIAYLPADLQKASIEYARIICYGKSSLLTYEGNSLTALKPKRYMIATIPSNTYVYVSSKTSWEYVPYYLYTTTSGRRILIVRTSQEYIRVFLYFSGYHVETIVKLNEPGRLLYIEDLQNKAWRKAAEESINEAYIAVEEAEKAYEQASKYTAYSQAAKNLLEEAKELLLRAQKDLNASRYISAKLAAESAFSMAKKSIEYSKSSSMAGSAIFAIILAALAISSLAFAQIIFDGEKRIYAFIALTLASWALLFQFFPEGSGIISLDDPLFVRKLLMIGSFLFIIAYFIYSEIPQSFEGQSRESTGVIATLSAAISLAARNLRRRPLRSVLTFITMAAAVFAFVAFSSVGYGISITKTPFPIHTSVKGPAIKIGVKLYLDEVSLVKELAPNAVPAPRYLSPSYKLGLRLKGPKGTAVINGIIGVDFEAEDQISGIGSTLIARGNFSDERWIVISSYAAKKTGLKVGDIAEIYSSNGLYEITKLRVAGIFSEYRLAGISDINGAPLRPWIIIHGERGSGKQYIRPSEIAVVPPKEASKLGARFIGYAFYIPDEKVAEEAAKKLVEQLGVPVTYGKDGIAYTFYRTIGIKASRLEAIMVVLLSGFTVANAMIASVYERRKELSIYTALGMNPSHVSLIFIFEAILLGASVAGYSMLAALIAADKASKILGVTPSFTPEWLSTALLLSVITGVVAGLKPAEKASLQAVPSLIRRWSFKRMTGGEVKELLPFRIDADLIGQHLEFVKRRIESTYPQHSVLLRTLIHIKDLGSEKILEIDADLVSEGRASAVILLRYRRESQKYYSVELVITPKSVTGEHYMKLIYSVVDEIRKTMLAWQALYRQNVKEKIR